MFGTILRKLGKLSISFCAILLVCTLSGHAKTADRAKDAPKGGINADIDYSGMASNLMTSLYGKTPDFFDKYLDARQKYEIGKAIWSGNYNKAVSKALQFAKDKAIGKVPVLSQLYAMGQLGKELGDLAWMTYGPGEFDKIYDKYFKDLTKNDLSQPPDDFIKAMIEEGSATVLFSWLDQRAGKAYTRNQKVAIIWDMIRKRRNFEILCKKHHLQKNVCTNEKLIKLEQNDAAIIAMAAKEVEQDSKTSTDLAQALFENRKSFDRSYVSGLSWSISLREVLPFKAVRSSGDRAFWSMGANIRRYPKSHKNPSQMANYFVVASIRVENNSGSDLKGFHLKLKAQLEENDCLTRSGTISGMAFIDAIDPSRPAGGIAPGEVYDKLYRPIDEANMEAKKHNLPAWYRSAVSEKSDLPRGESRLFAVLLGATSRTKLTYSSLVGQLYGGAEHRQPFGVFLRRPLTEPVQPPAWALEAKSCPQQRENPEPLDHQCSLSSLAPGISLTDEEVSRMKVACASSERGILSLGSSHLKVMCRNNRISRWSIGGLPYRLFGNRKIQSRECSSIRKLVSWKIDVGKSRSSTKSMFRIHVTNNSGMDLPRFRLTVKCARGYLAGHTIDKKMFEYFRHPPVLSDKCRDIGTRDILFTSPEGRKCQLEAMDRWASQHPPVRTPMGYCSLQKLRFSCDASPWKSGLKAGETKTYKVIYNGCGGIVGKLGFNSTILRPGIRYAGGSTPPAYMSRRPDYLGDIGYFLRYRAHKSSPKIWKRRPISQADHKKQKQE